MKLYKRTSSFTDVEMREVAGKLDRPQLDKILFDLGITHNMFENWMKGMDKLPNRNKFLHAIGLLQNEAEMTKTLQKAVASQLANTRA